VTESKEIRVLVPINEHRKFKMKTRQEESSMAKKVRQWVKGYLNGELQ